MEGIFGRRRLLDPRTESEKCQVRSHCIQKTPPHRFPLLTSLHYYLAIMSANASSISTVSSLPTISLLSSRSSSPTSTRSDAGWGLSRRDGRGSPDVHHMPTPPPAPMEPTPHSPLTPSPILSIDIPLAAHRLREGTLDGHHCDILHSHLYAPHLHHAFEFHLEPNSPLWSVTRIYLQNQRLKAILNLASSPSSIGCRCNTLCTIQQEVEEDLFSTFYQMQMPEFADDLECYIRELTTSTNLQPLPSTSSSPLSPEVKLTLQRVELRHKVDTTGTIHGILVDAPLSCNHLITTSRVSNATTSDTSASTVNGTSVRYAKSTALATLNNAALWAVLVLVPLHPHDCPPPNLVLSLLLILNEWSWRTLVFAVATLAPVLLLVLIPLSGTLNTMISPFPT